INFPAPASPAIFGTSFTIAPSASSGLAVTVTAAFNGCSILGATVTRISGTLSCQLTASQAGDANYLPAPDVVHVVTAAKAPQATITLTMPATDTIDAANLVAVAAGGSST